MTRNQIDYWNLQEQKRSNRANEENVRRNNDEVARHNKASESLGSAQLVESVHHNRATEQVNLGQLNESIRHNKAGESLSSRDIEERIRHNKVGESNDLAKLAETYRSNVATLNEAIRSNKANESLKSQQNAIAARNLSLQAAKTSNEARQIAENIRHNKSQESLQQAKNDIDKTIRQAELDLANWRNSISERDLSREELRDYNNYQVQLQELRNRTLQTNVNSASGLLNIVQGVGNLFKEVFK